MSMPCFYLSGLEAEVELKGEEARHLQKVLRMRVGEKVRLLDGRGHSGIYGIAGMRKGAAFLVRESECFSPRPQSGAIMAVALSRAVRRGFFMEKAVELGALAVWIWQGARSQGRLEPHAAAAWQRQMVAGAKQCANPWLPELRVFDRGIGQVAAAARDADFRVLPWERQDGLPLLTPDMAARSGVTVYVIGPEGGFAESELEALRCAGFEAVSLGDRVLRCETAAVLCLGIHWWASGLRPGLWQECP